MAPSTDTDRTSNRMFKLETNMDCRQRLKVLGTEIADGPLVLVIFVCGQAMLEIGDRAPSELAWLIDSALE